MLTEYRREASKLIAGLPKGSVRETNATLRRFIETENETLKRWYNALQMRLLQIGEFEKLISGLVKQLKFDGLKKKGVDAKQVKALVQELLSLFRNICGQCSGIELFCNTYPDYKVRIYTKQSRTYNEPEWEDLGEMSV